MNFLAHLYLSGDSEKIKVGNFIGDWIKGRKYENYPQLIKTGILMHRDIDAFTDRHPVVFRSMERLKTRYHLYAGIIVDIFYDHFLAAQWEKYSSVSLHHFVRNCYFMLVKYYDTLPFNVQKVIPSLIINDRLKSYAKIKGIQKAIHTMTKYTSLPWETEFAIKILKDYYDNFKADFNEFFPEIIQYIEKKYSIIISQQPPD